MKTTIRRGLAWLGLAAIFAITVASHAAITNTVLRLDAGDVGFYDVNGEHDPRNDSAVAGTLDYYPDRSDTRGFLAFHIPEYAGTLARAVLEVAYYQKPGIYPEMVQLREVTTPVEELLRGGFGKTHIHQDLGDGLLYGERSIFTNAFAASGLEIPLNSNAVAAISSRRGAGLAMGCSLALPHRGYVDLAPYGAYWVKLRLEIDAPDAPVLLRQPQPRVLGSNVALVNVQAMGTEPVHYNWFVNGQALGPNYNQAEVYLGSLGPTNTDVSVVVSNAYGMATSSVVRLARVAGSFSIQDTNVVGRVGGYLTVNPYPYSHSYPYSLHWFKNGQPHQTFGLSYLVFSPAQTNDSGNYQMVISNSFGMVTSSVMRVSVEETPPLIWRQPESLTNAIGTFTAFYTEVVGGPSPQIQWYRNGSPVPDQNYQNLYISSTTAADSGNYYLVVTNHLGSVTSRVVRLELFADPPVFQSHPQSAVTYAGMQFTLSAYATAVGFVQPRWYHNGTLIPQGLAWNLVLNGITAADNGTYYCVASNASGVATSAVATVTVLSVPPVLGGPEDVVVAEGRTGFLSMMVSNPPATVVWRKNGSNYLTFVVPSINVPYQSWINFGVVDASSIGLYDAVVSNPYGTVTSRLATLTFTSYPPAMISQPSDMTFPEGTGTNLLINADAAPAPVYFLLREGQPVQMSLSAILELSGLRLSDAGQYTILISNRLGLVESSPFRISVQRVGPLDRWTLRNPQPQGEDLQAVTHSQGRYVAVGNNGAIISSPDATNWTAHSLRTRVDYFGVAAGNGRFVAVGELGNLLTSTNGTDWNLSVVGTQGTLMDVIYQGDRFLAVGQRTRWTADPVLYASTNGLNWAELGFNGNPASYLRSIAYGAGTYVVVDAYGGIFRSTDLSSWSRTSVLDRYGLKVRFLNNQFLITGENGFLSTSPDGQSWTVRSNLVTRALSGAAFANGRLVVVGNKGMILESTDSASWNQIPPRNEDYLHDVLRAGGLFVAVGERGAILTSPDGLSWSDQLRGSSRDLDSLATANGLAVAVGKNGTILTSHNGSDWTQQTAPGPQDDWHGVAYGNGLWVIVGDSTNILTSTDAMTWSLQRNPSTYVYLKNAHYANGLWVAAGIIGSILTSPDGTNWTQQVSPVSYDLNEVAYGFGRFLIIGDNWNPNTTMLTSSDGTNWSSISPNTGKNGRGLTFFNNRFTAVLNDGYLIYNTGIDLNSWEWRYANTTITGEGRNLRGIFATNDFWIAVGNDGRIITSTNGHDFRPRLSPTTENLHAVRSFAGTYLAVGNNGTILQSGPLASALATERGPGGLRLVFQSATEQTYRLQETTDFQWQDVQIFTNDFGTREWTLPVPTTGGHKFYRVLSP